MTVDNIGMLDNRCGDCKAWQGMIVQGFSIGICENNESDHCGHCLSALHPACDEFEMEGR